MVNGTDLSGYVMVMIMEGVKFGWYPGRAWQRCHDVVYLLLVGEKIGRG
jgi:hypothetical protein